MMRLLVAALLLLLGAAPAFAYNELLTGGSIEPQFPDGPVWGGFPAGQHGVVVSQSSTFAHSAPYSLEMTGTGDSWGTPPNLSFGDDGSKGYAVGKRYRASAQVYVPSTSSTTLGNVKLIMRFYNSDWSDFLLVENSASVSGYNQWETLTVEGTAPAGSPFFDVLYQAGPADNAGVKVYWDNIKLGELPEATPTPAPTPSPTPEPTPTPSPSAAPSSEPSASGSSDLTASQEAELRDSSLNLLSSLDYFASRLLIGVILVGGLMVAFSWMVW